MSSPINKPLTSLPPLHPSSSTGNLSIKKRSGLSKKVASRLAPPSVPFLVPIENPGGRSSSPGSAPIVVDRSSPDVSMAPKSVSARVSTEDEEYSNIEPSSATAEASTEVERASTSSSVPPPADPIPSDLLLHRRRSVSAVGIRRRSVLLESGQGSSYEALLSPPSTPRRLAASLDGGGGFKDADMDDRTVHSVRSTILPRITSQEARRGMAKSYLMVKNGKTAIQDRDELERCFPDGKVTIFVGTWNMAGQDVPSSVLADWLFPEDMHMTADIYVVGIQEAMFNPNGFKEWESKLQRCLWTCKQVLFHSVSLGVQHLAIFVRRELIWFLSRVGHCTKSTRIVSNVKTKGAVAIGFKLFGTTLLFISSHLSYGPDPINRIRDYHRIVQSLYWKTFGWRGSQVLDNADVVFWSGDLNFRLDEKRHAVERLVKAACGRTQMDYTLLMDRDQLGRELRAARLFHKFLERPITFPPTYKYDLGTSTFDSSAKNRVPAYTDRILYRIKEPPDPPAPGGSADEQQHQLEYVLYDSVPSVKNSDHKPVYGVFRVPVKPGNDHMLTPKFDTAIFQAGLQHRDAAEKRAAAAVYSKVCSLM